MAAVLAAMALLPDGRSADDDDVLVSSTSPASPAENSYSDYLKLKDSLQLSKEEEGRVRKCAEDPACATGPLLPLISAQGQALRHFYESRGKRFEPPEWADPSKLTMETPLPQFAPVSMAASLAVLQARALREQGKPTEALEAALRVAEVGQAYQLSGGSLLAYLMGSHMKLRGLKAVREGSWPAGMPLAGYAAALARLRPLRDNREGLKRALRLEYTMSAHMISSLRVQGPPADSSGRKAPRWMASLFFKPNRTRAMMAQHIREAIEKVDQLCPPTAPPPRRPRPWWKNPATLTGNLVGVILHSIAQPDWSKLQHRRCEEDFWTGATELTLAAIAFARQTGQPPSDAGQLFPSFLREPPLDPFSGEPLAFSPKTGEITSLGRDTQGQPLSARISF